AIWKSPETTTSGQSDRGGKEMPPRANTKANRQKVAKRYRKHAYQIGGTVMTPILIAGQLMAQVSISKASRTRGVPWLHVAGVAIRVEPSAKLRSMQPDHRQLVRSPQSASAARPRP